MVSKCTPLIPSLSLSLPLYLSRTFSAVLVHGTESFACIQISEISRNLFRREQTKTMCVCVFLSLSHSLCAPSLLPVITYSVQFTHILFRVNMIQCQKMFACARPSQRALGFNQTFATTTETQRSARRNEVIKHFDGYE